MLPVFAMTVINKENWLVTTNATEMQGNIEDNQKPSSSTRIYTLDEMDPFLERFVTDVDTR